MPPDVLHRLLAAAGTKLVLVGGQALAFWMDRYGVPPIQGYPAVSRDMDVLAQSAADTGDVIRLAKVLDGTPVFPSEHALTALVGQAVKLIDEESYLNVDVICRVYSANTDLVRKAALTIEDGDVIFRVMHPIDLLKSRLDNLYGLAEKRTPLGEAQLQASIAVAQEFQREFFTPNDEDEGRSPALRFTKAIEHMARSDAGRKIVERHRIHVADAIVPALIVEESFRRNKLPRLHELMSPMRWADVIKELGEG